MYPVSWTMAMPNSFLPNWLRVYMITGVSLLFGNVALGNFQLVISFTTIEWNLEASVCFEMLRRGLFYCNWYTCNKFTFFIS